MGQGWNFDMPAILEHRLAALLRACALVICGGVLLCLWTAPARAANCNPASSQGTTGPANWQTYCWLDLTSYNDATAKSGPGQNFNYTLPDGTVMTFNLKVTNSGPTLTSATAPSWTGAAVGNTAFLGIAGRPILYQTGSGGTSTVTISNIVLTPPPGSDAITNYMFVAADAESSNGGESLSFNTNGAAWVLLDTAGPTSGNTYPAISGVGTSTVNITGVGGTVGAHILGSATPTQVVTTMVGSGLQGVMFAVRFASIRLNMQIQGARVAAADQFKFDIKATSGGTTLATGTSSGAGFGPFTAASLTTTSALPITLAQEMAPGSASAIGQYRSVLTCTNSSTSSTPLPNGVVTTSYNFGPLQFGDNVQCTFTATPFPHLRLSKALGTGGRQFQSDQFTVNILEGSTVVATRTTTGTGDWIPDPSTPQVMGAAGTTYTFIEEPAGTTILAQYTSTMACTNAAGGSGTVLPTTVGGSVTPQIGDVISCIITNTKLPPNAKLDVAKTAQAISDPVNNTVNPFNIPGTVVRYTVSVANTGPQWIDWNSVQIIDALPPHLEVGTAANPVFVDGPQSSNLVFNPANDMRFSNAVTPPASFAACTYTPIGAYDPAVRYVCFNPKQNMPGSSGVPPSFTISFEARIK